MTVVFTGSHRPTLTQLPVARLEHMLHPPPIASNLSAGLMAHSSQRERRQGEYEARVGAVQLTELNSSSTGLCLSLVCVERQQALCCQRGRSSGATTLAAARG